VVDKVALGQVFSQYFGFPCQSSFHQLLYNHLHLSSGAGTIGQKWPQYKGLSPTPLAIKKITLHLFLEAEGKRDMKQQHKTQTEQNRTCKQADRIF
jgi:hypothetical protein